jgi:hypothetical protein
MDELPVVDCLQSIFLVVDYGIPKKRKFKLLIAKIFVNLSINYPVQ